VLYIVKHRS
jgi:death-on-curing protein